MELNGRVRFTALEILAYMVKHPEAKDSLTGIHNWWLNESDGCSDKDVQYAAEELLSRGLLCVWESSPGSVIFGPSQQFLEDPQFFMRQLSGSDKDEKQ